MTREFGDLFGESADARGQGAVDGVMDIVVGVLVLAFTFPIAINALNDANTTDWGTQTSNVWDTLPVLVILVGLMMIISYVQRFS